MAIPRSPLLRNSWRITLIAAAACALSACAAQQGGNAGVKLPFGGVNYPIGKQVVSGKFDVAGWALAEGGIAAVSLYLDRSFVADCTLGLPRPDVTGAFPGFEGTASAGFQASIDAANFPAGWHELTVQARSTQGATRDLASIPILIQR